MNEICVLLTASGSIASTSIINSLKHNDEKRKIRVVCTDINKQPLLKYKADSFHVIPRGNSTKYIESLLKICKNEKVDVLIPHSGHEILNVSKNINKFQSKGIVPTVSDYNSIKITMDKEKTYSFLSKKNIPIPKYYQIKNFSQFKKAINKLSYPKNDVCFKPVAYGKSGGSRGFRILRKKNSPEKIILNSKPGSIEIDYNSTINLLKNSKDYDLLIMELLPGREYSVYTFGKNGKMFFCVPNIRQKLEQYYSFEAQTQQNKIIEEICKKIFQSLNLSYNANIQLKLSKTGQPKLIEINPRMGGSIALPVAAGINLPYYAVKLALNEKIPIKKSFKQTKMIRYWREFFQNNEKGFELS